MKNSVTVLIFCSLLLVACKTSQIVSYNDDVYANPAEEKRLAKIAQEEQAKKLEEEKQKAEESRLAQKAKDDANPLYKDPNYNQDDYYDYQYASRLRRFNQPLSGAGYYDNYYTNSYYYNQNPAMYGNSIYSSYNYYIMPSNQFNNFSNGISSGIAYGYNSYGSYNSYYGNNYCGYNSYYPYGYNNYYGNGYYGNSCYNSPYGYNSYYGTGYGYSPYGYNGYSNYYGNNGGWGYFNGHDPNSNYANMTVAPRGSNGGNNGGRSTSAGMAVPEDLQYNAKQQFFNAVVQQQESTPRFTEVIKPNRTVKEQSSNNATGTNAFNTNQGSNQGTNNSGNQSNSGTPRNNGWGWFGNTGNNTATSTNESNNTAPRTNSGTRINASESKAESETTNSQKSSNNQGWNNWPVNNGSSGGGSNGGGSTAPRGSGGGGGRPR